MGVLMFPGTGGVRSAMALSTARGTAVQPQEELGGRSFAIACEGKIFLCFITICQLGDKGLKQKTRVWKLYKYVIIKE